MVKRKRPTCECTYSAVHEILRADVDDVAADGLGRVDGDGLVLVDLEVVEVGALVEHTLVDGLRDGIVDELADEETIVHRGEERVVLGVDGQAAADVPVLVKGVVDVIGEGLLLLHG